MKRIPILESHGRKYPIGYMVLRDEDWIRLSKIIDIGGEIQPVLDDGKLSRFWIPDSFSCNKRYYNMSEEDKVKFWKKEF